MDFSADNVELWGFVIQLGVIAVLMLGANLLRRKIPFIRKTLMPTSVLAGFVLLITRSLGWQMIATETLEVLTYHGIALGFIALSLRVADSRAKRAERLTAPKSGALIVSMYTTYGIIGLVISLTLAFTIMPDFFEAAGILLAMGYGQGPGQANNIGSTYEALGFAGGRSFALSLAAMGYLMACIVGVIYLNILIRKRKFTRMTTEVQSGSVAVDTFEDKGEVPISESIDRLSIQMSLVMGVYLLSFLTISGISIATRVLGENISEMISTLLWGFNFIVGSALAMLLRAVLKKLHEKKIVTRQYQNNYLLSRVSGFAFDLMIIAGIGSIEISHLQGLWIPFILMCTVGTIFAFTYQRWICKKLYPDYYFEAFVSMYGMNIGTISSGVLLLREIDPMFKTPAANNLITGSSMAIVFGAPMLALIAIAPQSTQMALLTLGLLVVYTVLLLLFMLKIGRKRSELRGERRE